jgi:prepilin-type N-terminal cleavage/methylation domain-containing protein
MDTSKRFSSGVSFIELIVVLAIIGIFAGYAITPMREMMASYSVQTLQDELLTHLENARSESIKRGNTRVSLTPIDTTGNDWASQGWRLFLDTNNNGVYDAGEQILKNIDRQANKISVLANTSDTSCSVNPSVDAFSGAYISFLADDIVHPNNNALLGCLKINHSEFPEISRDIVISFNARIRVKKYNEI